MYKTTSIGDADELSDFGGREVEVTVPGLMIQMRRIYWEKRDRTYELFPLGFTDDLLRDTFELTKGRHRSPPYKIMNIEPFQRV